MIQWTHRLVDIPLRERRYDGGIACQNTARLGRWSFCATWFTLTVEGRCGGGIAFQDSLRHVLWRSILDSCLVRSWKAIPPPQLHLKCSSIIRNHWPMISHIAEGYVQDERYFALEHRDVRREASRRAECLFSGCCAKLKQAASAHPCARGIPFILNISKS